MTQAKPTLRYLRLVEGGQTDNNQLGQRERKDLKVQTSFFSDASAASLSFVCVSEMSGATFQSLVREASPKYVFDLRKNPSFTQAGLSRKSAFGLFDAKSIKYYDVAGALSINSRRDANSNPALLIPKLLQTLVGRTTITGPVIFFVDNEYLDDEFIDGVSKLLPHQDRKGWEVAVWQRDASLEQASDKRKLVFISHANPQDNEVALWFASRLAAEGYDVWSDVTKLIGGETFWDTIETVIRDHAACVVVLLSKEGHEKPGVLDEVNIAIAVERRLGLKGFVIPVRVDKMRFDDVRANLARKNIIDGSTDLRTALDQTLRALESLGVAKREQPSAEILAEWRKSLPLGGGKEASDLNGRVFENKVAITAWPGTLSRVRGLPSKPKFSLAAIEPFLATAPVPNGELCFAGKSELYDALQDARGLSITGSVATENALDGTAIELLGIRVRELRRALSQIIRNSWDHHCAALGMRKYQLSSGKFCWFEQLDFVEKNEVRFTDHMSQVRRRALVGRSEKRGVYWHFGVEAVPSIVDGSVRLRTHVIFTEDGKTPIDSPARQHALRRGFCRNWWNDRWRDLLAAMLARISRGEDTIRIVVTPQQSLEIDSRLASYEIGKQNAQLSFIAEPQVEVGYHQEVLDPRAGLMLFGPVEFDRNPREIRVGVVGAPEGIDLFSNWCREFRTHTSAGGSDLNARNVPFPGFDSAFGCKWPSSPTVAKVVSRADLLNAIRIAERHHAVSKAVSLIVEQIRQATVEDDVVVDVWFVVVPEEVFLLGRPNSRVPKDKSVASDNIFTKRMASRFTPNAPSLFDEDNEAVKIFQNHTDFHHQLKNRLLELRAVTQLFRESSIAQTLHDLRFGQTDGTLEDDGEWDEAEFGGSTSLRRMQTPSDVNWNIGTACFFKAGGRPWKVKTARPGVCYVGLIFKRDPSQVGSNACCGAQLFLESGEGIVFKGSMGPWYSPDSKQFHLSKDEAIKLMKRTLEAYRMEYGIFPSELFVHGRTYFNKDELDGFAEAAPEGTEITGVRITRTSDFKLYSATELPINRGTLLRLSDRVALIWTSGYIPYLETYQGRETPNPLRVELCGSTNTPIDVVLADIMTLTKMNFNSAVFADGFPVTMRFADAIGDVLMATGDREISPLPFRYYI